MRTRIPTALVAAATLGLAACGGERPDMPLGVVVDDTGANPLDVSVTGDATPTYDWTGANARQLVVVRLSDGAEMWRIDAVSPGDGFAGPVTHGTVPAGASQARAAELLVSGTDFSVQVVNVNGTRGSASFRR